LLAETRTLTLADRAGLSCYAQAWSRLIEGETGLRTTGLVIRTPAGFPAISPFLSIVRQATEELRKWSAELGLTPSSRTKIKAAPPEVSDLAHRNRNRTEAT
jgi:P27 family predicted phage terminase small subunit